MAKTRSPLRVLVLLALAAASLAATFAAFTRRRHLPRPRVPHSAGQLPRVVTATARMNVRPLLARKRWPRTVLALLAAAAATAATLLATTSSAGTLWTGDFETGNFSQWDVVQAVAGDATVQSTVVHQGNYAAHIILRPGDYAAGGERADLAKGTGEQAGVESWWSWSTMFPSSFASNPNSSWNVFTDWHQDGSTGVQPISFEVENDAGVEYLHFRAWGGDINNPTKVAWRLGALQRNHWYDFVFHVKWEPDNTGLIQVWVDGKPVVPLTYTPTLYSGQGVYLKQGFYRNASSLTTDLYHDGMVRGDSLAAVGGPSGTGAFGQQQAGSQIDAGGANYLDISGPYSVSTPVTVTSLNAFILSTNVDSKLRAVIYADNNGQPGARMGVTPEITIPAGVPSEWTQFQLPSPVSMPAGKYWLGYWYADNYSRHYLQPMAGGDRYVYAPYSATGNPPSTYGAASTGQASYSMYANYTTGGGGGGSLPANTSLPTISGTAQQGQTLTASNGSWSGSPTSYSYQWQDCNSSGSSCTANGAAGQSYTLQAGDVNHTIRVAVTATNSIGSAGATSAATALVGAAPSGGGGSTFGQTQVGNLIDPGASSYLDVTGPYSVASAITVSKLTAYIAGGGSSSRIRAAIYADSGGQPGALQAVTQELTVPAGRAAGWIDFQLAAPAPLPAGNYWLGYWYADGNSKHYYFNSGAERYALVPYSTGGSPPSSFPAPGRSTGSYSIYATYTTGSGGGGASAPTNTALPVISGTAQQGQALSASNGSWNGSPTGYTYEWQDCDSSGNNCAANGATGQSYTLQAGDVGHTVRTRVTAANAAGSASATSAQTAVVAASGGGGGGGGGGSGTLGQSAVGSLVDNGSAGYLDVTGPYTASSQVSVTKLSAYFAGGSSSSRIRAVIYADSGGVPGALKAVTAEVSVPAGQAAGWVDLTLPSAVSLPAGSYWLGYWYSDQNSRHYYLSGGAEKYAAVPYSSSGSPPTSFPSPLSSSGSYSLYATTG